MLKKMLLVILSLPKSIYFNLRVLPFKQAVKLPILVCFNCRLQKIFRGAVVLEDKAASAKTFMIRIGFGGSEGVSVRGRSIIFLNKNSKTIFKGSAVFAAGCAFRVDGKLVFGDGFSANKNCFFAAGDEITFGDDVLLGWNICVRDKDGHTVYHDGVAVPTSKPVHIGSHVWIAAEAHIIKGVEIGDGCIVAYRSLVTKTIAGKNLLIGGSPAKLIKENIAFERSK